MTLTFDYEREKNNGDFKRYDPSSRQCQTKCQRKMKTGNYPEVKPKCDLDI